MAVEKIIEFLKFHAEELDSEYGLDLDVAEQLKLAIDMLERTDSPVAQIGQEGSLTEGKNDGR